MKCKAARHPFSLMEIMIVLVLVGVVASVSAFSLWPFYQSYRFRLEVETLYELLQELQLEAMTLQSDMKICFKQENGKWKAQSFSDEPILKTHFVDLSHVETLSEGFDIVLYSNGLVEKPKTLKFSHKDVHRWIDLSSGHLIKLHETAPKPIVYENLDLNKIKKSFVKEGTSSQKENR